MFETYYPHIVLLLAILVTLGMKKRLFRHPYLYAFLDFAGTLLHELSHALVAILFLGKIKKFSVFPKIEKSRNKVNIRFGYVQTATRLKGSLVLSSIAPLFIIPFIIYQSFFLIDTYIHDIYIKAGIKVLILLFIFPSALLSVTDLKQFFKDLMTPIGLLIFVLFAYFI